MSDLTGVSADDIHLLRRIRGHMQEADELMRLVSNETRDKLLEMHGEVFTLPHCIRWGEQAAAEAMESLS